MHYEDYYQQFIVNNPYPRHLKCFDVSQGASLYLNWNGKKLINFSSSDYLGLAKHPILIAESQRYAEQYGVGVSASRLVTGNIICYEEIEKKLAHALGKPAALILGSGYQTNISVLEALLDKNVLGQSPLIFTDKLCHVSMLTSTRHLAQLQRFRHNDYDHLAVLLKKHQQSQQPKFILVESVYSMEGDRADLQKLIDLAISNQAYLYVDDAHSVGVDGKNGWGNAVEYAKDIPVIMGTFSKALGSFGGYIGCSHVVKKYLVNKCKGLIYSTGLSPTVLGAMSAAIDLLPQMNAERQRLQHYSEMVRHFFQQEKINYGHANTHIIPWIIGNAEKTRQMSQQLEECGILGTAIQPPSVPVEKSRIRFCLSAAHTKEDIESLLQVVAMLNKQIA